MVRGPDNAGQSCDAEYLKALRNDNENVIWATKSFVEIWL